MAGAKMRSTLAIERTSRFDAHFERRGAESLEHLSFEPRVSEAVPAPRV